MRQPSTHRTSVRTACVVVACAVLCAFIGSPASVSAETTSTTDSTVAAGVGSSVGTTSISGPSLTLDRTAASVGEFLEFSVSGFKADLVTVAVCGNEALRGSSDCDMAHAHTLNVEPNGAATQDQLVVVAPPVPCPCVVLAASDTNTQLVVAPLSINGMPSAPLTSPNNGVATDQGLHVEVTATPVSSGFWHSLVSQLGGSVTYEVLIVVRNRSTANLDDLIASGVVGRSSTNVLKSLDLPRLPALGPGLVWQHRVRVTIPAPSFGDLQWRVVVSHNGQPVNAIDVTHHRPWLLIVVALFLLFDVAVLLVRARVRARQAAGDDDGTPSPDAIDTADGLAVDQRVAAPDSTTATPFDNV